MTKTNIYARSSLAALAATLALSTTPAFAQEVAAPVDAAPAETAVPVETTTVAPEADALAPVPEAQPVAETTPVKKAATRAPAKPAPVAAKSTPVRPTSTASAPVAAPVAATAEPATPEVAVAPIADPAESPMTPEVAPPVTAETSSLDEMLPIFGGGALALLAIAGAGVAMRRRRKDDRVVENETWTEPTMARAPAPQPVVTTGADRSAFAWGNAAPVVATAPVVTGGDRIAAAYHGPTPDNPFLSMKRRIKRAAFFEQRDRAVREGKASPLSPMAGLPRTLVQRIQSAVPARQTYAFQPA